MGAPVSGRGGNADGLVPGELGVAGGPGPTHTPVSGGGDAAGWCPGKGNRPWCPEPGNHGTGIGWGTGKGWGIPEAGRYLGTGGRGPGGGPRTVKLTAVPQKAPGPQRPAALHGLVHDEL